jgi:hypothetical protein
LIPKIIAGRPGLLAGSFPIELGDPDATAGKDADLAPSASANPGPQRKLILF